jgi:ferritin-like metal-binding protein YciE
VPGEHKEDEMQLQTLDDLFKEQIGDLYSAEKQLTEALPKMAAAASNDKLQQAFEHHLGETQDHVRRLEEIFGQAGIPIEAKTCAAMQGLIREGQEVITAQGDPAVRDAGLIGAAQRVEHYEIAAYGTARTLADQLGFDDAKDLLDQTLDDESNADKLLTKIATGGMLKSGINQKAAR